MITYFTDEVKPWVDYWSIHDVIRGKTRINPYSVNRKRTIGVCINPNDMVYIAVSILKPGESDCGKMARKIIRSRIHTMIHKNLEKIPFGLSFPNKNSLHSVYDELSEFYTVDTETIKGPISRISLIDACHNIEAMKAKKLARINSKKLEYISG